MLFSLLKVMFLLFPYLYACILEKVLWCFCRILSKIFLMHTIGNLIHCFMFVSQVLGVISVSYSDFNIFSGIPLHFHGFYVGKSYQNLPSSCLFAIMSCIDQQIPFHYQQQKMVGVVMH